MAWVVQTAVALTSSLDIAMLAKATIVLALGLAALPLARRARAAVRHLLMAATFGTVLVLPLIVGVVPAITIHVPTAAAERVASIASNEASSRSLPSFATLLRSVWAAGTTLLLVLLAIDLRRLRRIRRSGLPWPAQNDLLRSLAVTSGVRRSVDVLLHEAVSAPLTCGVWRPAILVPVDASEWQEADLRRALVHELEHVRRGDWATQLIARLVCACYWFHPLVWMAWGRLRLEAERACDDAVLQCAECTEYAEQLVSLARRLSTYALPSLAMADRSDLSARVGALLDGTRRRGRVGYATTATVVGLASLVVLLVTSVRAIAAPAASLTVINAAQPARRGIVASRLPDRAVPAPALTRPQVTRVAPAPTTRQRARRPISDRSTVWRDSAGFAQSIRSVIERPSGGSATAERTIIHSSTASGTATNSGSASSSAHSDARRDSNH
ncbi:MAG: M56 family metallopeptidase [Gemmatimonadaceae bacterium]